MKSKAGAYPYAVWMALFILIPMVLVVYFAFTAKNGAFSLNNFIELFHSDYLSVFLRSFQLALLSTLICLVLGFPFAYILSKQPRHQQSIFMMLIMLPMWMNFLLRTYAWLTLLENNGLINKALSFLGLPALSIINTPYAVLLGMVYNYLPFMILPIYTVLVKLDQRLIEAAQDLGASSPYVFRKVVLPLSLPGVISGITMVFVPSVSTFVISKMLGGGTYALLGDLIDMQFMGAAYNPHLGAAISLIMMVVIFICMGVMSFFDDGEKDMVML